MSDPIRLLHLAPWIRTTGGVETLLARHAQADAGLGFSARQLALFDRGAAAPGETVASLGFSWKSTPRGMRRALAGACAEWDRSVIAWHNAWGLAWLADLDHSHRRIACLQDSVTHFGPLLPGIAEWVDGVTCLSESAARAIRAGLPALDPARIAVMPLPIAPPAELTATRPEGDEWLVGCAGRLVRPQKRWDRLVPFVEELRRLGVRYRIEVISDGPLRPWLEQRLGSDPAIRFLGWQRREDYWRRMQAWDACVSFTDHEGGPIVLLEAMAAGVIPLYPAVGGSLGDDCAPQVDLRCHYPAGDPLAAARALQALMAAPQSEIEAMRRRAQAVARVHRPENYEGAFADFVRRIAALPRVSRPPGGGRVARASDLLPLGFLARCWSSALARQ